MALTEAIVASALAWVFALRAHVWRPSVGFNRDDARSLGVFGALVTGGRLANYGQQNFDNTAFNSRVLAWITGGESLHNNHHAHPRAPKFSVRTREFDPSWPVIRVLAAVRLIAVVGASVRLS